MTASQSNPIIPADVTAVLIPEFTMPLAPPPPALGAGASDGGGGGGGLDFSTGHGRPQQHGTTPQSSGTTISLATPTDAEDVPLVRTLTDIVNAVYAETEADIWGPGFQRTSTEEVAGLMRERQVAVAWYRHQVQDDRTGGADGDRCTKLAENRPALNAIEDTRPEPVGCIHIARHNPSLFEFGMLAVHPTLQSSGVGRQLVLFAESHARSMLSSTPFNNHQEHDPVEPQRAPPPSPSHPPPTSDSTSASPPAGSTQRQSGKGKIQLHLLVPSSNPQHTFKTRLRKWYERMGYVEDREKGGGDFATAFPALAPLLAGPVVYHCLEKELF